MSKKIIVLGAGLVGRAMALDLAKEFDVTSADARAEALTSFEGTAVKTVQLDFTDKAALSKAIQPFDLVVGAVPGFMGFETAKTVIEAGKNMADISFFPEDPFLLDELAKSTGVTIVTDCGVAPGMSNIILGYHYHRMNVTDYECLVGGLPVVRQWPYEYKAVFSPIDVIEEYTRPARYVQNGGEVVKEALSDTELIHFDGVGTLESWNSDGLRSLIRTMKGVPNMIEKTLRYPGTMEYIRVLRETGFFSKDPIDVNGVMVRPLDLTARLLFPIWKLKPGEEEYTVMRVRLKGEEKNEACEYEYYVMDRTDLKTGTLSMARTTGFTCTATARLILNGTYQHKGISPAEFLGEDERCYRFILDELKSRGVIYRVKRNGKEL